MNTILVDKSLHVRVYETLEDARQLLPAWDELTSRFPSATAFSTPQWLLPWWSVYGNGQRLKILGFFYPEDKLVALAPLYEGPDHSMSPRVSRWLGIRVLKLMGDGTNDSANLDLAVIPGYEEMFIRTLLDHLHAQWIDWDVCMLNTMRERSPAANELLKQLRERGWPYHVSSVPCAALQLPPTWESYLEKISSNQRAQLGRKSRRLEKQRQTRFHRCEREDELADCLETLFRLHQTRFTLRGVPGAFRSETRRRFYREMSRNFLARGDLEFWFLDVDGKPAAAQFAVRYRETAFQLAEGFDPAYAADSVGFVLKGHVLRQLIARDIRRYDFLTGVTHYKTRWGADVGACINVCFSKPNWRGTNFLRLLHGIKQYHKGRSWLRRTARRVLGIRWLFAGGRGGDAGRQGRGQFA